MWLFILPNNMYGDPRPNACGDDEGEACGDDGVFTSRPNFSVIPALSRDLLRRLTQPKSELSDWLDSPITS